MKSDKIADAVNFAWERPARKPSAWPIVAILLLMVAHAGFSFLAVGLFGNPR